MLFYIPPGTKSIEALSKEADAIKFINETFKNYKPIALGDDAVDWFMETPAGKIFGEKDEKTAAEQGIFLSGNPDDLITALGRHRFWNREKAMMIPA